MKQIPIKTKSAKAPLNKSAFLTSPRSEEIFDIINEQKGKVPISELYRRVKALDPNLPSYTSFNKFLKKLDKDQDKRAGILMERLKNNFLDQGDVGENVLKKLLDNAYKKLFVMGDIVMDQTLQEVREKLEAGEKLNPIEKKTIMEWFFKGTDAFAKHRTVDLKAKADERTETLMENLISAAQYGHIDKADIVEGEIEEDSNELKEKSNEVSGL